MTILLLSGRKSQGDDRQQPEGNGVTGHHPLKSSCGDKQALNTWMVLLRPGQVFLKGLDGTEQQCIAVISHEVVKGRHREFLKARVRNGRILGLSKEEKRKYRTSNCTNDEP